ncbi:hypothetical protein [Reinekea sp. G2M2-21]|uniref:hypothetical protein n=1 Tax=Reinekea sp. G2M2-21 TaxID=2788942 RepID=UPI0018AC78FD|nr:hypothetical protein [Reinekea sp. G2M2-21]
MKDLAYSLNATGTEEQAEMFGGVLNQRVDLIDLVEETINNIIPLFDQFSVLYEAVSYGK